jgi:hypothetical protein
VSVLSCLFYIGLGVIYAFLKPRQLKWIHRLHILKEAMKLPWLWDGNRCFDDWVYV